MSLSLLKTGIRENSLADWFSRHECTFGYCKIMELIFRKNGVLKALYSERDTVVISAKAKTPSWFVLMVASVNVQMIFVNS